jgi:hypothetical protein
MSLVISKVFTYDTDAGAYIQRVEGASGDNAALEPATRQAINNFVIGCKQDGIWNAIKASCILSGARTLNGALQPLVGTAPTNFNFVSGDYNRKTGLVGNATNKYLNSNRNNNADPQNSQHLSVYASSGETGGANKGYLAIAGTDNGVSHIIALNTSASFRSRSSTPTSFNFNSGFLGVNRAVSSQYTLRAQNTTPAATAADSVTPISENLIVFGRGLANYTNARLAFYSIGESLDLALLDARVTALITAFGVVIP